MAKPTKSKTIKKPIIKRIGVSKKFTFTGIDDKDYILTEKEKAFCEEYIKPFSNGVRAVIAAGYEILDKNTAKTIAYENITKPHISQYIQVLLQDVGLNDNTVDKALLFNITQTIDLKAKNGAIDQYNKMKGRLAPEKHEHTIWERLRATPDEELDEIINGSNNR